MHDVTAPSRNVARTLAGAFVILLASLVWTVIMPGVVAGLGDVFYKDQIGKHLPAHAAAKLNEFEKARKARHQRIADVDAALQAAVAKGEGTQIPGLLQLQQSLRDTDAALPHQSPLLHST